VTGQVTPDEALRLTIDNAIRDVPDFPKPGVLFKDITPLLADWSAFRTVVEALADAGRSGTDTVVDKVVGMEARGFIFGAPVALDLEVGFVPIRKPGKLPGTTTSVSYDLEYGSETLEMHTDAIAPGDRVLLVDDILATGGTARAAADLVQRAGGHVHALAVVLELSFLPGRATLGDVPLVALRTV
jgi:adenine phosphoribosyltransferase